MLPSHSDRPSTPRPMMLMLCVDCGQQYDAYGQVLADQYLGSPGIRRFCPPCRDIRRRALEAESEMRRAERLAYQHEQWLNAQIPEKFREATFETFDATGNEDRVQALREYAENFPVTKEGLKGKRSVLIARDENGVGKTHLACAFLSRIIQRTPQMDWEHCPYQFWTSYKIKHRLQAAQRFGSAETVEKVYLDFGTMWLLVLDDLGKEKAVGAEAAAAYEMYYTIINERYERRLPMVITSNIGFQPSTPGGLSLVDLIGKAGASRLMEMCRGTEYLIAGGDRR